MSRVFLYGHLLLHMLMVTHTSNIIHTCAIKKQSLQEQMMLIDISDEVMYVCSQRQEDATCDVVFVFV